MKSCSGILSTVALLACGTTTGTQSVETRCPEGVGEFRSVACAVVRGRVITSSGAPAAGLGVRVYFMSAATGQTYTSNPSSVSPDGTFELIVRRTHQLVPRTVPDTESVEIKVYGTPSPALTETALHTRLATMTFAPLGARVEETHVELIVPSR